MLDDKVMETANLVKKMFRILFCCKSIQRTMGIVKLIIIHQLQNHQQFIYANIIVSLVSLVIINISEALTIQLWTSQLCVYIVIHCARLDIKITPVSVLKCLQICYCINLLHNNRRHPCSFALYINRQHISVYLFIYQTMAT